MTLTLTQMTDLQRVRIALSSLNTAVTSVKVERSLNELLWMTVRGGTALPIVSGAGSLDDYEWFDGVENHYRVTTVDPPPGLLLDGTDGDHASTPDAAVLDITNVVSMRVDVTLDDYDTGTIRYLLSKYDFAGDQRSFTLRIDNTGELEALISSDGTGFETAGSGVFVSNLAADGERIALRADVDVDDTTGDWTATFWSAPTIAGPWTQIGSDSGTLAGTALFNSTVDLAVGAASQGTNAVAGTIHAAELYDDGVVVANPDFTAEPSGTSSFDDDAGLTWTMQGDAEIVTSETNSITPSLDGEVWLKSIRHPFLNRALPRVLRRDPSIGRRSRSEEFPVTGRSVGIATTDVRLGQQFTLSVLVETDPLEWARDMDLILASGDIFFIHTPVDSVVPGGYVMIGESRQDLLTGGTGSPQEFTLPCTVMAAPSPLVVGTTMVWGTVRNLYGSWEAIRAANPTWGDLLAGVSSPDDLVVL